MRTVQEMERMSPFGAGNPRPLLSACDVEFVDGPRPMGKGDRHLNGTIRQHNGPPLRVIAFNRSDWIDPIKQVSGQLDVAFRPVINEFGGRRKVELFLEDWREGS